MRERARHHDGMNYPDARELWAFIADTAAELERALVSESVAALQGGGDSTDSQFPVPGPRDFQECPDDVVETRREVLRRLAQ